MRLPGLLYQLLPKIVNGRLMPVYNNRYVRLQYNVVEWGRCSETSIKQLPLGTGWGHSSAQKCRRTNRQRRQCDPINPYPLVYLFHESLLILPGMGMRKVLVAYTFYRPKISNCLHEPVKLNWRFGPEPTDTQRALKPGTSYNYEMDIWHANQTGTIRRSLNMYFEKRTKLQMLYGRFLDRLLKPDHQQPLGVGGWWLTFGRAKSACRVEVSCKMWRGIRINHLVLRPIPEACSGRRQQHGAPYLIVPVHDERQHPTTTVQLEWWTKMVAKEDDRWIYAPRGMVIDAAAWHDNSTILSFTLYLLICLMYAPGQRYVACQRPKDLVLIGSEELYRKQESWVNQNTGVWQAILWKAQR